MSDAILIDPEWVRPLRRSEYDRMVELGLFLDERVELLQGALAQMPPQGAAHAEVVGNLNEIFTVGVRGRARVRVQSPLAASENSEPVPDLALVPTKSYLQEHPTEAVLVVEVAESSQRKDRTVKAGIYARAGVPEYWLIDLPRRRVEVRSSPLDGEYSQLVTHTSGTLRPSAFPDLEVPLSRLLAQR